MNIQLKSNFLSGNQLGSLYHNGDPSVPGPVPYRGRIDRKLTLNEDFDDYGRLIQRLGTFTSESLNNAGIPTWGLPYISTPTETPSAGSIEVWQIFNLTGDTHPIHFHLVNVQVIQRSRSQECRAWLPQMNIRAQVREVVAPGPVRVR